MQLLTSTWKSGTAKKLFLGMLLPLLCTCGVCAILFFRFSTSRNPDQTLEKIDNSSQPQEVEAPTQSLSSLPIANSDDDLTGLSLLQENTMFFNTSARFLLIFFYSLFGLLIVLSSYMAVQTFRRRVTWGQARYMGVPLSLFFWLQFVFYLVLAEGVYDIVGFILKTPLWLDCLISGTIMTTPLILYFKLKHRATFKSGLFIPLVLLPLGLPATHFVGELAQVGAIKFVRIGVVTGIKNGDELKPLIIKHTIGGSVKFADTHAIGRLGDALTVKRLTALGYSKLNSKYTQIHGIDGIYLLQNDSNEIVELLIVENKVDTGRLGAGAMSDEWVLNRTYKMINSGDEKVIAVGKLILELLEKNPSAVKKQLWHHDLETGITTVKEINANGTVRLEPSSKWQDNFIKNQIQRWCQLGSITCSGTVAQ